VDILDALALAHRVDAKSGLRREWDFNHDGTIDRADADAIGMRAVSLTPQNGARPG
jgi:hypothetical protein